MAKRVFLHIGLPKTATSYLQTILWSSRDQLRAEGLLLPGTERRDHLWASRVVREGDAIRKRPEREQTSWDRLRAELAAWDGDGLVSHEFFAAASAEQAVAMVEALAPAQVEVVVTAREPLGLFTASWQESLKNKATTPMADYSRTVSPNSTAIWNWRTLDLRLVLERWSQAVPHDRIHVLPLDRTAPRDEIWHRFGGLLGLRTADYDLSQSFPNESMGVVEAEVLRRVNAHLDSFDKAFDRGVYIRTFLADERLVPRKGEPFWPYPDQVADCRERSVAAIDYLTAHGVDVVGDIEHLRVPEELPVRRTPDSVTEAEVAAAATELVAVLLGDVRELRNASRKGDGVSRRPGRSLWRRRSGGR
ncbi:hypothetical protein CFH99_08270 [Nocardioides aromaticivorans]|uniref:Sulfotransferase family protein n=1 Tax=Nocardioides aromaticivorans TaxID=200618 RepID=A0ABX7PIW3_9ACTN|nr:hypothetical protein [Nocardioides aromaticivorans]QSR25615.1 hypothetical protein CFH99_08270 [Nocardioides aromaticivorans]